MVILALVAAQSLALSPARATELDGAPGLGLRASRPAFSPNRDGIIDATILVVTADRPVRLTLEIVDAGGTLVRDLQRDAWIETGETRATWRGRDDEREPVPDGHYVARATATDETGAVASVEFGLRVDTRAPRFRWRSISPDPVVRADTRIGFSFEVGGADRGRLLVADARGRAVHRDAWVSEETALELMWNLRTTDGRVPPGLYRATVTVRDTAGNVRASEPRPFRDRHPATARVVRAAFGAGPRVALTFDDCINVDAWKRILTTLGAADAHATFFCSGGQVLARPALARRTVREGNAVGSHGWDHADATRLGFDEIASRLARDDRAWWRTARAMAVPFYRPAYGTFDDETRRAAGSRGYAWIALWNVDPADWRGGSAREISSRTLSHVGAGSIVVLHVQDRTADALPTILRGLRSRGLRPVTLLELVTQASSYTAGRVARMPV